MNFSNPGSNQWYSPEAVNQRVESRKHDLPQKSDAMRRAPVAAGRNIKNAAANSGRFAIKFLVSPLQLLNHVLIIKVLTQGIIG